MSTDVTMQELELETAELLPSRETLGVCKQPLAARATATAAPTSVRQHEPEPGAESVTSPSPRSTAKATRQHPQPVAPARLTLLACALPRGGCTAGKGGPPWFPGAALPPAGRLGPGPQTGRPS